eukprot:CAMPEP_0173408618 /NCGR_PEP_ID=MMETSP1356-20130122/70181_1 /TAXON_ID=77927 ORGANISM="Hemiselmis virescens, Strain PCC157" /NCGR_SAMPLE_ID=MMETSP1356 /ASSEMBLY_ACC=CAM_ASM_000847 /LENGTH=150 /DNA_ID=CAMNT_0014369957 /DNA_START=132 /DNA_END=580 /DNA_ORIENTATION=+
MSGISRHRSSMSPHAPTAVGIPWAVVAVVHCFTTEGREVEGLQSPKNTSHSAAAPAVFEVQREERRLQEEQYGPDAAPDKHCLRMLQPLSKGDARQSASRSDSAEGGRYSASPSSQPGEEGSRRQLSRSAAAARGRRAAAAARRASVRAA